MKTIHSTLATLSTILLVSHGVETQAGFPPPGGDGPADSATSYSVTLTSEVIDGLVFLREEEKLARDVYLALYEQWQLPIFANIAHSEQQHMDALLARLEAHDITDPVTNEAILGDFTNPTLQSLYQELLTQGGESSLVALQVGAYIEEVDIADLQAVLDAELPRDIRRTYEQLLRGSRNHLRAFVGQLEAQGVVYSAQALDAADLDTIVNSAMERGGRRR